MTTKNEAHQKAENDWVCVCGTCHVCGQTFERPYRNEQASEGCACTCHGNASRNMTHAKVIRQRQATAWKNGYGASKRTGVICNF